MHYGSATKLLDLKNSRTEASTPRARPFTVSIVRPPLATESYLLRPPLARAPLGQRV